MTLAAKVAAPFVGFEGVVEAGWIDVNRHMNVGWYDHVFGLAEHRLFHAFGVDDAYILRAHHGMFRVEKRIRYERELLEGEHLRVDSRIVSFDGRVLKHLHELYNVTRGVRAGIGDYVSIHVDLSIRKAARVSDPDVLAILQAMFAAHAALPPAVAPR